jgi:hypothetical protein
MLEQFRLRPGQVPIAGKSQWTTSSPSFVFPLKNKKPPSSGGIGSGGSPGGYGGWTMSSGFLNLANGRLPLDGPTSQGCSSHPLAQLFAALPVREARLQV